MGRAPCCDKNGLKKGLWTTEEDQTLINYVQLHGPANWRDLPKKAGLQRCGKSCRLRWTNYLRPDIKRGRFAFEEEETIIQLHSMLGNKWSAIAARLPGRTDNEIKNYWNTHIRKRLLRSGIDPVTHAPRFDVASLLTSPSSSNLLSTQALGLLNLATALAASLNPQTIQTSLQLQSLLSLLQQTNPMANSFLNQTQASNVDGLMFNNMPPSFNVHNSQEDIAIPSSNYLRDEFASNLNPTAVDLSDNSTFQTLYDTDNTNFNTDLIKSTSPAPLPHSTSTVICNSSAKDDIESNSSSFFQLGIPESFDFDDFM